MSEQDAVARRKRVAPLRALVRSYVDVSRESDPVQAVWRLVSALREDLSIDRAGVFACDHIAGVLDRVAGVDPHGEPEFAGETLPIHGTGPLERVARREIPYFFSDDAPRDYPHCQFQPGVRGHAVIPIIAGDAVVGALCVDNCLTGKPISETSIEALFLYAGLAALPLFALYQKKERDREEALRRVIHREVMSAVTSGRIVLCDQREMDSEWPRMTGAVPITREEHVRDVREAAKKIALRAGMSDERAADLALCASEAATNALLHGRGGSAAVEHRDGKVRIRVADTGSGIDPLSLSKATLQKGWSSRASMGLGFTVINETADRLFLATSPGGTTLIVEMAVEPTQDLLDSFGILLWEDEQVAAV
jgi:anti-sigma regulatory factor (Ser/Thr protein kinase)